MSLAGKTALITGGSEGIGLATAQMLLQQGANVVITGRDKSKLDRAAAQLSALSPNIRAIKADVTSSKDARNAVQHTVGQFGKIDILINNAGLFPLNTFLDISERELDSVLDTNLKAVFLLSQAVARTMVKMGVSGKIIMVTSTVINQPGVLGLTHYAASKSAVSTLAQSMAFELTAYDIAVKSVMLGPTKTPGTLRTSNATNPTIISSMAPLGPLSDPSLAAEAILQAIVD